VIIHLVQERDKGISRELCNEPSVSAKGEEFFDLSSEYQLIPRTDSIP
jgi:hypothetical protein